MSQTSRTEAACLLEQGALYRTRVALESREPDRDLIFAGIKPGGFSVYSGDQPYVHFDLDGRWQRAFIKDVHYLKGLDGSVQSIDRVRENEAMVLDRRTLSYAEAGDLDAFIRSFVLNLTTELDAGLLMRIDPPAGKNVTPLATELLRDLFDRIIAWDAAAWFAHRERYLSTYGPLPLVPPDSQGAILLQATLGNASGRAFGLATAAEFYARTPSEFEQHARDVSRLLGRRVADCRSVLLLGVDLFHQPAEVVSSYLEIAGRDFSEQSSIGGTGKPRVLPIHAVLDDFARIMPDLTAWSHFRQLGLARVTLEIESGDPDVRAIYQSQWQDQDLVATAQALKAAGIGINVLTLVAPGGTTRGEAHVARTAALLQCLELTRGDFVFLLDEREFAASTLRLEELVPHDPQQRNDEFERLTMNLVSLKNRGVKVLRYTLEKQRT